MRMKKWIVIFHCNGTFFKLTTSIEMNINESKKQHAKQKMPDMKGPTLAAELVLLIQIPEYGNNGTNTWLSAM